MVQVKHLPLPYFEINKNYDIQSISSITSKTFAVGDNFLNIVDDDSKKKVEEYIQPKVKDIEMELVLNTIEAPTSLFNVYVTWEGETGHIICQPLQDQLEKLSKQLDDLRARLTSSDFDLIEKKEELEQTLIRVNKLSGPFIPLSERLVFVPLFGDLDKHMLRLIKPHIVDALNQSDYSYILFDFSAVDVITQEGLTELDQFFQTIQLLGQKTIISGIKPAQATTIKFSNWFRQSIKVANLETAINRYLVPSKQKNKYSS